MIQRVYEQASKSRSLAKVVVATDDERILNHVKEFGGEVVMTSDMHQNGTERCAEALSLTEGNYDAVINIQGDEPFIQPEQIDSVAECLNEGAQIATLVKRIINPDDLENFSVVKVVVVGNSAVGFSRKITGFTSGGMSKDDFLKAIPSYKHIGIYGYKTSTLIAITKLRSPDAEKINSLEQLRWLDNDYEIRIKETAYDTVAVDTPEDLERIVNSLKFEV